MQAQLLRTIVCKRATYSTQLGTLASCRRCRRRRCGSAAHAPGRQREAPPRPGPRPALTQLVAREVVDVQEVVALGGRAHVLAAVVAGGGDLGGAAPLPRRRRRAGAAPHQLLHATGLEAPHGGAGGRHRSAARRGCRERQARAKGGGRSREERGSQLPSWRWVWRGCDQVSGLAPAKGIRVTLMQGPAEPQAAPAAHKLPTAGTQSCRTGAPGCSALRRPPPAAAARPTADGSVPQEQACVAPALHASELIKPQMMAGWLSHAPCPAVRAPPSTTRVPVQGPTPARFAGLAVPASSSARSTQVGRALSQGSNPPVPKVALRASKPQPRWAQLAAARYRVCGVGQRSWAFLCFTRSS